MIYTHTVRSRSLKEARLAGFLMVRNFVQDKFRAGYKQAERNVNPLINLKITAPFHSLLQGVMMPAVVSGGGTSADRGRAPPGSNLADHQLHSVQVHCCLALIL